jgi:hypothetical protein
VEILEEKMKFGMSVRPLIEGEKPVIKGKCKDCRYFMLYSLLPFENGHKVCWQHDIHILEPELDWCYDYERKWWKVWK